MPVFTPSVWEGISSVTVVILVALFLGLALIRGWLVLGPAHRELLRVKDEVIADSRGARLEDQQIIKTQADTIYEQRVSGDVSAHLLQALRSIQDSPTSGDGST